MYRMRVESLRLLSFHENCQLSAQVEAANSWQPWNDDLKALDPTILSKNGFCYFGIRGVVKCGFCSRRCYPNLHATLEQLQLEHGSKSPNCKFDVMSNMPIEKEYPTVGLPITDQIFPGAFPLIPRREYTKHSERTDMHIYARSGYFNINMITIEERKKSFCNQKQHSPAEMIDKLASAGFYFKGPGAFIECYQCGLGLLQYNHTICPFEAHILYNSGCSHTFLIKGERFVEKFKVNIAERFTSILNRSTTDNVYAVTKPPTKIEVTNKGALSDDKLACIICYQNIRNIMFFPCRHIALCHECASNIHKCSVCNNTFTAFTRVYIA